MSKFRFIGDPKNAGEGPATIEVFGHSFGRAESTEVPDAVAARLRKHTHFEEVSDAETPKGAKAPKGKKAED